MLPVRFLAESFGAAVGWDGATSTATVTGKDGRMITIQIGAPYLTVDGQTVPLDSPAYIDGATNRTYLPVRAIAEALGATVDWNGETSTATLCKVVKIGIIFRGFADCPFGQSASIFALRAIDMFAYANEGKYPIASSEAGYIETAERLYRVLPRGKTYRPLG